MNSFCLTCPPTPSNINTVMNDAHKTIDSYIKALHKRSTQVGGLDYALGFLYSTLMDLKLQGYELERLMADTATLNDLIDKEN